eukprot:8416999-Alexandrium_andersonii.AAC.1
MNRASTRRMMSSVLLMWAPSAPLSSENSARHATWALSMAWRVSSTVPLRVRISICACSRSVDKDAA